MKQKPIRSPKHLARVRKLDCTITNKEGEHCNGLVISHHLTFINEGGLSKKVGDNWVVPLSVGHHAELHRIGERPFWKKYGFTLDDVAAYAAMLWRETLTVN